MKNLTVMIVLALAIAFAVVAFVLLLHSQRAQAPVTMPPADAVRAGDR